VEGVVYLLAVMLTTVLTGRLVKLGQGYGTIIGSNLYKNHRTLFAAFLIEAIVLSLAFPYFQIAIDDWLWTNIAWFPTIIVEAVVAYYCWFCLEFGFQHQITKTDILAPQIVLVINYLHLLPMPFRP
jgi:hypothetical protein